MDIKWRNMKYSKFSKGMAFILAVVFLIISLTIGVYLAENTKITWEAAFKESYLESTALKDKLSNITWDLKKLLKEYKSDDYIKAGGTLSEDTSEYSWELRNLYRDFKDDYYTNNSVEYNSVPEKSLMAQFEKEYAEDVALYENKTINNDLNDYYRLMKEIDSINGLSYYMSSGEYEYTNATDPSKEYFKGQPVYLLFDNAGYVSSIELSHMPRDLSYYPQDIIYVSLNNEFLKPMINQWNADRELLIPGFTIIASLLMGFILCLIYLVYVAGRRGDDDKIHLLSIDKFYVDINIIATIFIIGISFAFTAASYDDLGYVSFIPSVAISAILGMYLLLSIVKHIKNKTLITHTLTCQLLRKIYFYVKRLFNSAPLALRMLPTPNKADDLKNIIDGVAHIKNGKLDYMIHTRTDGIYGQIAKDINSITDGLKAAVNNELKSERLKTELISNVSHDIRTPLTSIITYMDLLKKEGLDSENAEKYLDVLDQKSLRLKTLTDDLFEASKASSGNIPINFEKIDIISLLTQGMGELDEKIISSGLDFKFNDPKEEVFVKADGKRLWRVIENLVSNIFKYSLKNSRVYIDVVDSDNSASIIIKNISAYELNTDADELMERFKRGDESRNSEGSGLGLSIAKSLVELQNGKFHIEIDGDLFKAIIEIPKYE